MRKPRSDSKLDALPAEVKSALERKLMGPPPMSLRAARAWLLNEHEVKTTLTALSVFYARHCAPQVELRTHQARHAADVAAGRVDVAAAAFLGLQELKRSRREKR